MTEVLSPSGATLEGLDIWYQHLEGQRPAPDFMDIARGEVPLPGPGTDYGRHNVTQGPPIPFDELVRPSSDGVVRRTDPGQGVMDRLRILRGKETGNTGSRGKWFGAAAVSLFGLVSGSAGLAYQVDSMRDGLREATAQPHGSAVTYEGGGGLAGYVTAAERTEAGISAEDINDPRTYSIMIDLAKAPDTNPAANSGYARTVTALESVPDEKRDAISALVESESEDTVTVTFDDRGVPRVDLGDGSKPLEGRDAREWLDKAGISA